MIKKYSQLHKANEYERLLTLQRLTDGMKAAIKDPVSGKIYSGWTHQGIINALPNMKQKGFVEGLWGRLSDEWDKSTDNVGFLDKEGKFITRSEADKRFHIQTMEDLRDLQQGKNLVKLFHTRD